MSITTARMSHVLERNYKKSLHQRHDSGELDVFEAARYFSGANEVISGTYPKPARTGRISLDIPIMTARSPVIQAQILRDRVIMTKNVTQEKKYKQPSSPGGRLASFLNSLFTSQNSSKKKKPKSNSSVNKDDQDHESPVIWRRKRRSSISHFPTSTSTSTTKLSNNFVTTPPPPHANTPTKNSLKLFRNSLDHRPALNTPSYGTCVTSSSDIDIAKKNVKDHTAASTDHEKYRKLMINNEMNIDDGGDSDSSSDLFELPNYDLGSSCYSSGLPVYETTHMDSIKRHTY